MDADGAVAELFDSAALWLLGSARSEPVIRAACEVIAAGIEGPHLLMLAATSVNEWVSRWEFDPLVARAVAEAGHVLPARGSEQAQSAAATAMARRVLRGEVTCRRLASWAHRVIGHEGALDLQRLVVLDDEYDLVEYDLVEYMGPVDRMADLDAEVRAEARRLCATSG